MLDPVAAVLSPLELEARLADNEELDSALTAALEAGARSSLKRKRRLLGRVVAGAVLDDARVDEATLIVGVLAQIDAPHVRCLEAIGRAEDRAEAEGEIEPRAAGAERAIVARIREAALAYPPPVVAALTSPGLLETTGTWGGTTIVLGLTPFGRALLADLYREQVTPAGE